MQEALLGRDRAAEVPQSALRAAGSVHRRLQLLSEQLWRLSIGHAATSRVLEGVGLVLNACVSAMRSSVAEERANGRARSCSTWLRVALGALLQHLILGRVHELRQRLLGHDFVFEARLFFQSRAAEA